MKIIGTKSNNYFQKRKYLIEPLHEATISAISARMGTRRSRHNKGRKPLYKEHRDNLVNDDALVASINLLQRAQTRADLYDAFNGKCHYCGAQTDLSPKQTRRQATIDHFIPLAKDGLDERSNMVLACFECNHEKGDISAENFVVPIPRVRVKPTKLATPENIVLIREVEEFLSRRKSMRDANIEERSKVNQLNAITLERPELVKMFVPDLSEARSGAVSPHDIVAQLFFDKAISANGARAARIWQRYMHEAMLQPSHCVDWSAPISRSFGYQERGTVSERQFTAMKFRNAISKAGGRELVSSLDIALDFDIGRQELRERFKLSHRQVSTAVAALLERLCICAAAIEGGIPEAQALFWRSADGNGQVPEVRGRKTLSPSSKIVVAMRQQRVPVRVLAEPRDAIQEFEKTA